MPFLAEGVLGEEVACYCVLMYSFIHSIKKNSDAPEASAQPQPWKKNQTLLEARDFNPFLKGEGAGRIRDLLGNSDDILSDILAAGALRGEKAGQ